MRTFLTPGHTRAHQSVLVESGGETVCFIGDLVPTQQHLSPVYVMAYDLYPRTTFLMKQEVLGRAAREGWRVVWPHDPMVAWSYVTVDAEGEFAAVEEQ